jgi:DNA repair protein RadA/Sms
MRMARANKRNFVCRACGATAPRWAGQCAECGAWNTVEESIAPPVRGGGPAASPQRLGTGAAGGARIPSGFDELDRVLGGGLLSGAVVLIGGDPGVGKSTLLLQVAGAVARGGGAVLYATGEESAAQVEGRALRLGLGDAAVDLLPETGVDAVIAAARARRPQLLVVDSIQTMVSEGVAGYAGSVSQVREGAALLTRFAKQEGITVVLVGHVTKEGALAGPRVLEHTVDCVLYFENDAASRWRVIRAVKNRFGAVNELGVFAMTEDGLREVRNPSAIFLSRHAKPVPGSVVAVTREGSRPLLVEVQALVAPAATHNPRRLAVGIDGSRLALLLAVLARHAGLATHDQDVFLNLVGGLNVNETAIDLAVALAVLSSLRNRPVAQDLAVFGELGLAGELRPVPHGEERLREAAKQGFRRIALPAANAPRTVPEGVEVVAAHDLHAVLALV